LKINNKLRIVDKKIFCKFVKYVTASTGFWSPFQYVKWLLKRVRRKYL